jgi:hypothetical protein
MHFGYLGDAYGFSYIIQGPMRGMYALYMAEPAGNLKIEEFPNLEAAMLAAEKMEENKC